MPCSFIHPGHPLLALPVWYSSNIRQYDYLMSVVLDIAAGGQALSTEQTNSGDAKFALGTCFCTSAHQTDTITECFIAE